MEEKIYDIERALKILYGDIVDYEEETEEWEKDCFWQQIEATEKEIIAHVKALEADNAEMAGDLSHLYDKLKDYEALEAEVERLRWHYPERGGVSRG